MCKKRGFTFVELMFSVAIMGSLVLVLASSFLSTSAGNQMTTDETEVHNAIQEKLEEVMGVAIGYQDLKNGVPFVSAVQGETGQFSLRAIHLDALIPFYSLDANRWFDVSDLEPVPGNNAVGQVIIYTNEAQVPMELGAVNTFTGADGFAYGELQLDGEDLDDPDRNIVSLATPKRYEIQITGDDGKEEALITGWDATASFQGYYEMNFIPVEIRVEWMHAGARTFMRRFMLVPRTAR